MLKTAIYLAIVVWIARFFVIGFYRIGYAIGWTLVRIVLFLGKMLFGGANAAAVRDELTDESERPAGQRADLLYRSVHDPMLASARRVMPYEAMRYRARLEIHPPRKGRQR